MPKKKKQSVPDPTRGKTRLIWESTYEWTSNFFNEHPELKVGAEVGIAGGQHIKTLMENTIFTILNTQLLYLSLEGGNSIALTLLLEKVFGRLDYLVLVLNILLI